MFGCEKASYNGKHQLYSKMKKKYGNKIQTYFHTISKLVIY